MNLIYILKEQLKVLRQSKTYELMETALEKLVSDGRTNQYDLHKKICKSFRLVPHETGYDGSGTPLLFSDKAIMTVHEIRQVVKLPLRQCEGFVIKTFHTLFQLVQIFLMIEF